MNKPVVVQKFGGTSMGSIERIAKVAEHVIAAKEAGQDVVVVVSAMAGETNRLLGLAQQIDAVPQARELDVLLAAGEQVAMALLAMTLNTRGYRAQSLNGAQARILTNTQHNDATIRHIDCTPIRRLLAQDTIVIVAGFQGVTEHGDITTLGRGGSDTSAVVLAGALSAEECQIYTDVDGVYTSDPRIVTGARKLASIDFDSMEVMASFGAKVLHLPSVRYAAQHNIPLRVLSTFDTDGGSMVVHSQAAPVTGLALLKDAVQVELHDVSLETVLIQCQSVGIEVVAHVENESKLQLLIRQEAFAKLELVFDSKIHNSDWVSLLTLVGTQASELAEHAKSLLDSQHITPLLQASGASTVSFSVVPNALECAANILHDTYVVMTPTFA
ncbi:aspartate kinase [Vibrio sp. SM6]|uniref:Aspartokinase n=1 Tax=Vibrio agarilyticus TaxID=2726741 RepID=A0A7X8YGM1_9VIBR|nr:aspartate kinase [Vibrio agarilyticus]